MKLVNVGFGSMLSGNRIVAIVNPDASPIKRIVQESKDKGVCIDATHGRKTRTVIFTDCGYVVLSAMLPETIAMRVGALDNPVSSIGED